MADNRRGSRGVIGTATGSMSVSPKNMQGLSEHRKEQLSSQMEAGIIKEGGTNYNASKLKKSGDTPLSGVAFDGPKINRGIWDTAYDTISSGGGPTARGGQAYHISGSAVGAVAHSASFLQKQATEAAYAMIHKEASGINTGGGTGFGTSAIGSGSVERLAPEVYSPMFTIANLNLPRDRVTINAWCRNYHDLHPIVRNAITLHATYPISKLNLKCHDKKVLQFFEDMCEDMGILEALGMLSLEFWKMGEKIQGSSLITMADGTLKQIVDVQTGDYVITHLGNKKKVVKKFIKPTNKVIEEHLKVYKIHILGVPEPLIISGKHPILTSKLENFMCSTPSCKKKGLRILPGKERCGNCRKQYDNSNVLPDFAEMNEVKEKDIVYAPFNSDIVENDNFNKNLCYLMGIWLAEGSYCKSNRKEYLKYDGVKFTNFNMNFIQTIESCLEKHTGNIGKNYTSLSTHFAEGKNKYDYWFYANKRSGPQLAKFFLKHLGEYSKTKKLSEEVMLLPPELQKHIIAGFIEGDGCIDTSNGHALICSSSKNLINQFVLILRRLGLHPTYTKVRSYVDGEPKGFNYRISLAPNEFNETFGEIVNYKINNKKTKWTAPRTALQNNWQVLNITKIEDITEKFYEEFMYDIEVEDDHSYVANGIAIHNCFPYAVLNEDQGKWDRIIVHNPDYIHVKKAAVASEPMISMKPDALLQRLAMSNNPADIQVRQQIPEEILHFIRTGKDIPLNNFNVSHLKMLSAPYDVRGTSVIVSAFKDLMLYDKLREAKFAQADGLVNPITVVSLGGNSDGDYRATQEDLEFYRNMLEEAQYDKDFKLITHAGVKIERVGSSGAVLDIANDMELIIKNIYTGLMVPPSVVESDASSYSSASIGLEVLRQRYFNFRNLMASWLQNKIFAPIAELQKFYEYKDGVRRLIVPEVEWNQMNLYDLQDYIGNVTGLLAQKQVSLQTVYKSLGLNYDDERVKLRQEMINEAISLKEQEAVSGMTLTELRSLDPEKEIMEPVDATERPKKQPSGEVGGMDMGLPPPGGDLGMGGGLGGGDMGGLGGGLPELAPPPGPELGGAPAGPAEPGSGGPPGVGPGV